MFTGTASNGDCHAHILIIALVCSCINCCCCHSHTICKFFILVGVWPVPAIRKRDVTNLLCTVRQCHRSFRHVWSFRCLVDRKTDFHINSIIIICIWWCKCHIILCLSAVGYCRLNITILPCKCSCYLCSIDCFVCCLASCQGTVRKLLSVSKCGCCRLLRNYRCCLGYCDGCFSGKFCVMRTVCWLEYPARLCGSGCRYLVRITPWKDTFYHIICTGFHKNGISECQLWNLFTIDQHIASIYGYAVSTLNLYRLLINTTNRQRVSSILIVLHWSCYRDNCCLSNLGRVYLIYFIGQISGCIDSYLT